MNQPPFTISVANDYTKTPGPRNPDEGKFSGEDFLRKILDAAWVVVGLKKSKLRVDLDGTEGYATSFLEAAFGGLARKYGGQLVLENLELKSDEEPYLIDEINGYIRDVGNQ